MEPTLQNINFMFDGPGNVLKPFMSRVFERLRRPDVDADFANEYIVCDVPPFISHAQ